VETEAAVKCTQCYLMFASLTTLSPSLPIYLLGLIAVQPGLYLCLSSAICGVMFEGDCSLTSEYNFEARAEAKINITGFFSKYHFLQPWLVTAVLPLVTSSIPAVTPQQTTPSPRYYCHPHYSAALYW